MRTRIPGKGEACRSELVCGEIAQFTLDLDDNARPKEGSVPVFIPAWHFFSFLFGEEQDTMPLLVGGYTFLFTDIAL